MPAVLELGEAIEELKPGQTVLLDGFNGFVIISPSEQTLFDAANWWNNPRSRKASTKSETNRRRLDGHTILSANIERAGDVEAVRKSSATEIGLFRTEFLFINRADLPKGGTVSGLQESNGILPEPVIIRTLDLGGDKLLSDVNVAAEMNQFLGWRAIRLCLEEKDLFRTTPRHPSRQCLWRPEDHVSHGVRDGRTGRR